jgi:hypothetical protein
MAEAAALFQKGLDQLALLPDDPDRQRQELEFRSSLGAVLRSVKGLAAPETGLAQVDPSTGAAQASLTFQLPVARGQAQPSLGLVYSSAAGVGFAGVGWSLNLPSIERKGAAGFPKFVDDPAGTDRASACSADVAPTDPNATSCADRFMFAGQHLVAICVLSAGRLRPIHCDQALAGEVFPSVLGGWTYFRTEIDDGNRYFWSPNRATWILQTPTGITSYFGRPPDLLKIGGEVARHGLEYVDLLFRTAEPAWEKNNLPPALPTHILDDVFPSNLIGQIHDVFRWNLIGQVDASGNGVVYQWDTLTPLGGCPVTPVRHVNIDTPQDRPFHSSCDGMQYLTDIYDTSANPSAVTKSAKDLAGYAHHTHL